MILGIAPVPLVLTSTPGGGCGSPVSQEIAGGDPASEVRCVIRGAEQWSACRTCELGTNWLSQVLVKLPYFSPKVPSYSQRTPRFTVSFAIHLPVVLVRRSSYWSRDSRGQFRRLREGPLDTQNKHWKMLPGLFAASRSSKPPMNEEAAFEASEIEVPLGFFIFESSAHGVFPVRPGDLVLILNLVGGAIGRIQAAKQIRETEGCH